MFPADAQPGTLICGAMQKQDLLLSTLCLTQQIWSPGLCSAFETNHYSPATGGADEAGNLVVHCGSSSIVF